MVDGVMYLSLITFVKFGDTFWL